MEPKVKEMPTSPRRLWPLILASIGIVIVALGIYFFRTSRNRDLVSGLVADPSENLTNTAGRTNLVFLGMGGEGHQAPDLTDSIIFVSLRHSDHSIAMLSIPRDVWVDTMKAKVNTAYHYGEERREGGGRDLAKSAVSEIVGQPVHYAIALDFNGFIKAIDAVGGIDVTVDNTFDDYKYPIPGKETAEPESERYEHLHFDAGDAKMDGITALKFSRSRYAEGEEGTDFARSKRQQKIILAFKDKMLESKTFLNLDTLKNVISSFSSSIDTDVTEGDYGSFLRYFLSFDQSGQSVKSLSIEEYLSNPKNTRPYQGQWVLVPVKDWQEIHAYVAKSLE